MKRGHSLENPLTENETRKKYFEFAKSLGCDQDLIQIFNRYDRLLKNCTNVTEKHQIAIMANVEVHKLFSFINPLIVAGQEILSGDPSWDLESVRKDI